MTGTSAKGRRRKEGNKRKKSTAAAVTYTIGEVAAKLNIGLNEAYAAARRGDLPVIRIGRSVRVLKPAFDRMIEGGTAA